MRNRVSVVLRSLAVAVTFAAPTGALATTYNLNSNTACCGLSDYGTVDVTVDTSTELKFTVSLTSPVLLHASNQTGNSFQTIEFNMNSTAVVTNPTTFASGTTATWTLSNTTGFAPSGSPQNGFWNSDGIGNNLFQFGILCSGPGNLCGSSVTIDLLGTNLGFNSEGGVPVYFGVDVSNTPVGATKALTGIVAATLCTDCAPPPPTTPLPGAVWLLGSVLAGGAGFGRWRKKRKAAA